MIALTSIYISIVSELVHSAEDCSIVSLSLSFHGYYVHCVALAYSQSPEQKLIASFVLILTKEAMSLCFGDWHNSQTRLFHGVSVCLPYAQKFIVLNFSVSSLFTVSLFIIGMSKMSSIHSVFILPQTIKQSICPCVNFMKCQSKTV